MERASGTSEGRSTSSGEEGPRYLIGQVDVDEGQGGFEQRRDFLGGLSVVKHRVSLFIYQRGRVRSASDQCRPQFARLGVRLERRSAGLRGRGEGGRSR